jgi:hypothetical protein
VTYAKQAENGSAFVISIGFPQRTSLSAFVLNTYASPESSAEMSIHHRFEFPTLREAA